MPKGDPVRRAAKDVDRQDPEIRAARKGMGRPREPNQLEFADASGHHSVDTSENPMRHLNHLSLLLFGLGIAVAVAGILFDAGAVVTLVGMMLVVAGIVKIITVR